MPFLAQAQYFPGLNGQELLDAIVDEFKPDFTLSYADARDTMYASIYNVEDSVACIYSGHKIYLPPGIDPSTHLHMSGSADGISAEHSWPQSLGAGDGNPRSNMHHLYPARNAVNSARENFPFAEIEDEETTSWYYRNEITNQIPTENKDLYSERVNGFFEPREDHKGNVARAMFYFYTIYNQEATSVNPDYFELQKETLCRWHYQDPPDSLELVRTQIIASHQDGKVNPFILDCSVATRSFCSEWQEQCPILYSSDETKVSEKGRFKVYPNPASEYVNFDVNTIEGEVSVYDMMGREIKRKELRLGSQMDISRFTKGIYNFIFKIDGEVLANKLILVE